jgi:hypothetical protein
MSMKVSRGFSISFAIIVVGMVRSSAAFSSFQLWTRS